MSSGASPPVAPARVVEVVFLIDITGSMGNQIAGVKAMVSEFCNVERPGVRLHLHTFTEDTETCAVTASPRGLSQPEVSAYIRDKLQLCHPPDMPELGNLNGGDGPENAAAGLATICQKFSQNDNVICFLITDAPPHCRRSHPSEEAKRELEWLARNGFPQDIFKVANHVTEGWNVTICPVMYKNADLTWFTQLAGHSTGLLLFPTSTDSRLLASGLHALVESIQQRVNNDTTLSRLTVEALSGYRVVTVEKEDFVPLGEDPGDVPEYSGAPIVAPAGAPAVMAAAPRSPSSGRAAFGGLLGGFGAAASAESAAAAAVAAPPSSRYTSAEVYTRSDDVMTSVSGLVTRQLARFDRS